MTTLPLPQMPLPAPWGIPHLDFLPSHPWHEETLPWDCLTITRTVPGSRTVASEEELGLKFSAWALVG
jgi:hypothetical protein